MSYNQPDRPELTAEAPSNPVMRVHELIEAAQKAEAERTSRLRDSEKALVTLEHAQAEAIAVWDALYEALADLCHAQNSPAFGNSCMAKLFPLVKEFNGNSPR